MLINSNYKLQNYRNFHQSKSFHRIKNEQYLDYLKKQQGKVRTDEQRADLLKFKTARNIVSNVKRQ